MPISPAEVRSVNETGAYGAGVSPTEERGIRTLGEANADLDFGVFVALNSSGKVVAENDNVIGVSTSSLKATDEDDSSNITGYKADDLVNVRYRGYILSLIHI